MHQEHEGPRGESAPRKLSGRGLAYWTDGKADSRIVYVTPGYQMLALDAKTGAPVRTFGKNGLVDLKLDDDQVMDSVKRRESACTRRRRREERRHRRRRASPGGVPRSRQNEKGYVRGFDVRSGKRLWIFHTIPQLGEFGNDTWEKDRGPIRNAGRVGPDVGRRRPEPRVLPVELPTGDYYGGHRPAGALRREHRRSRSRHRRAQVHYQLVHHGVWDMDIRARRFSRTSR